MKGVQWMFLGFSILTVFLMMLIGVAIGERSVFGTLAASFGVIIVMGTGFMTKKKLREKGKIS